MNPASLLSSGRYQHFVDEQYQPAFSFSEMMM
jgi:hypothetical protein